MPLPLLLREVAADVVVEVVEAVGTAVLLGLLLSLQRQASVFPTVIDATHIVDALAMPQAVHLAQSLCPSWQLCMHSWKAHDVLGLEN